jgi:hypothetical protein
MIALVYPCAPASYSIGDRVGQNNTGKHGTVIAKLGGTLRIRWDDGSETSGGFMGSSIVHLRKNPLEVYNANRR